AGTAPPMADRDDSGWRPPHCIPVHASCPRRPQEQPPHRYTSWVVATARLPGNRRCRRVIRLRGGCPPYLDVDRNVRTSPVGSPVFVLETLHSTVRSRAYRDSRYTRTAHRL